MEEPDMPVHPPRGSERRSHQGMPFRFSASERQLLDEVHALLQPGAEQRIDTLLDTLAREGLLQVTGTSRTQLHACWLRHFDALTRGVSTTPLEHLPGQHAPRSPLATRDYLYIHSLHFELCSQALASRLAESPNLVEPRLRLLHKLVLLDLYRLCDTEHLYERQEQHLLQLIHGCSDPMALLGDADTFLDCNRAALALFGVDDKDRFVGRTPMDFLPARQPDGTVSATALAELIERTREKGFQRFEWRHKTVRDPSTPLEVTLTPTLYHGRNVLQVVWRDLTDFKLQERRIKRLAYFDELTGLPNRNLFADRVGQLLEQCRRSQTTLAVIYLDVIKLHDINETLGHTAGDALLQSLSDRLSQTIRSADTLARLAIVDGEPPTPGQAEGLVSREFDSLARMTGDEFALCAVVANPDGAAIIVRRLLAVLGAPFRIQGSEISLRARCGIALAPIDGDEQELLIRHANIALHHAKERNAELSFYDAALGTRIEARAHLVRRLELALKQGTGLQLHYQPQVDLHSGRLSGAEVLLRWHDVELGWVSPAEFIPLAEERGLIGQITHWVISSAGRQRAEWAQRGHWVPERLPARLAINISARDLDNESLPGQLRDVIARNHLLPQHFELELTETGLMHDPEHAIELLHQLKREGFALAIDDFGTGHSSLSYLKDINANLLKIDMYFVKALLEDSASHAIVQTVISTARIFGMKTLAEGVETAAVAEELRRMGCDYGQGYFFSRPLTAEQFEQAWLLRT